MGRRYAKDKLSNHIWATLMEPLAGFRGARDASSTNAASITAHAREQTGPPSKTVAQVLGEINWLMKRGSQ